MATLQSTDERLAVDSGACRVIKAGVVPYREAWDWQVEIAQQIREGLSPDTLLLLEHPHTYTRGRLAPDADLLLDAATRAARGIDVVETDRGGLITYHGPGTVGGLPNHPIAGARRAALVRPHAGAGDYRHVS